MENLKKTLEWIDGNIGRIVIVHLMTVLVGLTLFTIDMFSNTGSRQDIEKLKVTVLALRDRIGGCICKTSLM